jgi:hypothetical protein
MGPPKFFSSRVIVNWTITPYIRALHGAGHVAAAQIDRGVVVDFTITQTMAIDGCHL